MHEDSKAILVVEDSATQAERLRLILEQQGYRVAAARNGREALSAMAREKPQLVISDIIMPEIDGYQLCRLIRADRDLKHTPVILLTALSDPADVIKALECGADNFIVKPYDEPNLLSRIHLFETNRDLRNLEAVQPPLEIVFQGQKYLVNSDRLQILNLLLSTYEAAVAQNTQLLQTQQQLQRLTEALEDQVNQRTAALSEEVAVRRRAEEALRASEQNLRFLSSQLLTAQEQERRRLSLELHDELGQSLILLKLQLRNIERNLPPDQVQLRQDSLDGLHFIDEIIENVRRLSRELRPSMLEDLGLSSALRQLTGEFSRRSGLEIAAQVEEIDDLFSPDAQINIFRIFQESLTNIGKYAHADRLLVAAKKQDGQVQFLVEDDGDGFDLAQVKTRDPGHKGLGLTAMAERVRMLGGALQISSREGVGTQISFTIPTAPFPAPNP
ncbi:MAG: response regulator [Syntrophobacterales bacterium]|jgi:signal transduction histidine kinase|nr:response regulator [Syntrophobacterales bacterium]